MDPLFILDKLLIARDQQKNVRVEGAGPRLDAALFQLRHVHC